MNYNLIFLCVLTFFSLIFYLIWYFKGMGQRPWKLKLTAIYLGATLLPLFPFYVLYHLTGGRLYPDAILILVNAFMVIAASFGFFIPILSSRSLRKKMYNQAQYDNT